VVRSREAAHLTFVPWNLRSLPRRPAVGSFAHYDAAAAALQKAQDFLDAKSSDGEWTVQRATRAVATVRRMGEKMMMESERNRHVAAGGGGADASDDDEPTSSGTPPPPVTRLRQKPQALMKRK
jgi:hypothetical protein